MADEGRQTERPRIHASKRDIFVGQLRPPLVQWLELYLTFSEHVHPSDPITVYHQDPRALPDKLPPADFQEHNQRQDKKINAFEGVFRDREGLEEKPARKLPQQFGRGAWR